MSRARHKMKKAGGGEVYAGGGSNVAKEAMEKKHGGRVWKEVEKPEGKKAKARGDKRPRKASGGRVGSDKSPFSSAATPKQNTEA
ncbi:hypothetical protein [Bradyrhizobium cenepequi]|uniref:hypothetical protein n=1 Tax=Bradyrhizobium cenepequi TaxID=2821403 RepID=UPI001CE32A90|nr:hypothetical protein [Bradyrhizobium cenepequi]MCA6108104.1 hypothetical protein [Bradyrhizobium cenepequi]